jgi:hypothetical protein
VTDPARRTCEHRIPRQDRRIIDRLDHSVGRQCPDTKAGALEPHIRQPRDTTDVDECRGASQSEVHHRDETLSACDELGVLAPRIQQVDRFLYGGSAVVLEAARLYEALLKRSTMTRAPQGGSKATLTLLLAANFTISSPGQTVFSSRSERGAFEDAGATC